MPRHDGSKTPREESFEQAEIVDREAKSKKAGRIAATIARPKRLRMAKP